MSNLRDLYQEVILDHSRAPRNFHPMEDASHQADGYNPLCGDRVTIFLKYEDDVVKEVSFQGSGCAISTASASMLTEFLAGKNSEEVENVFQTFRGMLTGRPGEFPAEERLGKLAVFQGVCEFPTRVKCATLAWHTLKAALEGQGDPVSTE